MSPSQAPPLGFAMVSPGVFRSGFPTRHNAPFLQRLGLRTLVHVHEPPGLVNYDAPLEELISKNGVALVSCGVCGSVEPFVTPEADEIRKALRVLLDPANHPVLVHNLKGDGTVSVVIGCLRR